MTFPTRLLLASVAFAGIARPAQGQWCSPGASGNAPRIGVYAEGLRHETGGGISFSFNPLDRVMVGADLRWGGYDTGAAVPQSLGFLLAGRLSPAGVSICPAVRWKGTQFDFEDRFDAERGQIAEAHAIAAVEVAKAFGSAAGVVWGWRVTPAVVSRWRTTGRRWVLTDRVPPEVVTEDEKVRETLFEGSLALTTGRGDVGFAGGMASRSVFDRALSYFFEIVWTLS